MHHIFTREKNWKHCLLHLVIYYFSCISHTCRKTDQLPHPYITMPKALSSPGDSCPNCSNTGMWLTTVRIEQTSQSQTKRVKPNQYWCSHGILKMEALRGKNFSSIAGERWSVDDSIWVFPSAWQTQHFHLAWVTLPQRWLCYLRTATPFAMRSHPFWREAGSEHPLQPSHLSFFHFW